MRGSDMGFLGELFKRGLMRMDEDLRGVFLREGIEVLAPDRLPVDSQWLGPVASRAAVPLRPVWAGGYEARARLAERAAAAAAVRAAERLCRHVREAGGDAVSLRDLSFHHLDGSIMVTLWGLAAVSSGDRPTATPAGVGQAQTKDGTLEGSGPQNDSEG
jgi:hypothetical protein